MAKDIAASIRDQIKGISVRTGQHNQRLLDQFAYERFLYRLSQSIYKENFILKGALLFVAHNIDRKRPTRDIDFMGTSVSNNVVDVKNIIKEVLSVEAEDGIEYDINDISAEEITEDDEYHGVRVKFFSKLKNIRTRMQIDIGFGDEIINGPVEVEFPSLLDFPAPRIMAYSIVSSIAEKFEAMVSINYATSRYKDFYDILFFAEKYRFKSQDLRKAIQTTFNNRGTNLEDRGGIFTDKFKTSKENQAKWNAFLERNLIEYEPDFKKVIGNLEQFIEPALIENKNDQTWNPDKWIWKSEI